MTRKFVQHAGDVLRVPAVNDAPESQRVNLLCCNPSAASIPRCPCPVAPSASCLTHIPD